MTNNAESDLQLLLSPIQSDLLCGPNLEYDPDFLLLESMTEGRAEQQYGDAIIPAEEPDWLQTERQARQLLLRSKDLRTAHYYLRALTHTKGLAGLVAGLEVFAGLIETYWSELHPLLHVDGEPDSLARFFSIASLTNLQGFLKDFKDCVLLKHQNTSLSVRDVEQVVSNNRTDSGFSREQVILIFEQSARYAPDLLPNLKRCKTALENIEKWVEKEFSDADAPDLSPVRLVLETVLLFCSQCIVVESPDQVVSDTSDGAGEDVSVLSTSSQGRVGAINSRQDVERAIRLMCQYFQQHEPTNPAPLLLNRALRVMSMSFMDAVKDMAPEAVNQVQTIAGPVAPETF